VCAELGAKSTPSIAWLYVVTGSKKMSLGSAARSHSRVRARQR
jgi:hypothetical protein